DADHAVGLRKVAPELAAPWIDVLGHESEPRAGLQHADELLACLVAAAERRERIDVPEAADRERSGRATEVVGVPVAVQPVAVLESLLDGADRRREARVRRRQQAELAKQQRGRVDAGPSERRRE